MFVDPGAKELIDKLTARVATLERQVQALLGQLGDEPAPAQTIAPEADGEVLALLGEGKTVDAINAHRAGTGASLGEAKEYVDRLKAEHGL